MKSIKLLTSIFSILIVVMIVGCGQHGDIKNNNMAKDTTSSLQGKQIDTSFKSGYSVVNGIKMYYEIHGSGEPLVLLHGGGSTIQITFGRILPFLAKHRQVIAVELQAHGHTEDRNTPLSFEQDAEDVATLLKNLDIPKADFLGFSNGGHNAIQIAIRHPEIVKKLIIASAFYKRSGVMPMLFEGLKRATLDSMPTALKEAYSKEIPGEDHLKTMFERDRDRMLRFRDWSDNDIKSIKASTLLITGDADVVLPEHAVAMYRLIPRCRLAIIPGGHGTYLGEITALTDGKWTQEYITPLIEQFLDAPDR